MRIYMAGISSRKRVILEHDLKIPHVLESFYSFDDWQYAYYKAGKCRTFMVDSGAFTFMEDAGKAESVDMMAYARNYAEFIDDTGFDLFFELDVDAVRSLEEVHNIRNEIEQITGKPSIPVWHPSRGRDQFLRLCEEYDYVALGGIASGEWNGVPDSVYHWFINQAHKYDTKIHGLGIGSPQITEEFNFDSVDSTSWLGRRFGKIYTFKNGTINDHKTETGTKIADDKRQDVSKKNIEAWTQYARYLDEEEYDDAESIQAASV